MEIQNVFKFVVKEASPFAITFTKISECPICKCTINPDIQNYSVRNNMTNQYVTIFFICPHCNDIFAGLYKIQQLRAGSTPCTSFIRVVPNNFKEITFEEDINTLSPDFVRIYNQSSISESLGLFDICGIGYRKSLEFLVKDYAIHNNPSDTEKIIGLFLSNCISDYIQNSDIKTLALKATWIGNDETHYARKHLDRDFKDIKKFIDALVHFISMEFTLRDAEGIQAK